MTSYKHTLLAFPFIQLIFVHVLQSTKHNAHIQLFSQMQGQKYATRMAIKLNGIATCPHNKCFTLKLLTQLWVSVSLNSQHRTPQFNFDFHLKLINTSHACKDH